MGRHYCQADEGQMKLTRSYDKSIISLTNFNGHDFKGQYFKVIAWTYKLGHYRIPESLNNGLNRYYQEVKG